MQASDDVKIEDTGSAVDLESLEKKDRVKLLQEIEVLDNETSTEVDIDEEEESDEQETSYLETAFKGSNLIMSILFVTLTTVFFVLLLLLVILCRRIIMARGCKCC